MCASARRLDLPAFVSDELPAVRRVAGRHWSSRLLRTRIR